MPHPSLAWSEVTPAAGPAAYPSDLPALPSSLRAQSFMQRGADLTFLSAFPAEREYLFPPLTYLQPTGKVVEVVQGGSIFTVVEVEPFAG